MATATTTTRPPRFLMYTPEIETIRANEQEVSAEIANTMRRISAAVGDQFRHTMRPVHAKSHGLIRAKLTIQADVPEEYRQGLFAEPGTFDAIVRLSTDPGDLLPDRVSTLRGWAIKVIGTPAVAAMLPGHEQHHTQDFVCRSSWWTNRNVTTVWPSGDTHPWRILLQPDTPSLWNLHRENRVRSGLEQSDCSQEQKAGAAWELFRDSRRRRSFLQNRARPMGRLRTTGH